jgi:membrane fusion protein (multidrug efflux system)
MTTNADNKTDSRPNLKTSRKVTPIDQAHRRKSRRSKRFILLVVIPVIALLAGSVIYLLDGRYVETDDAYVKATKVPISAEVSGRIKIVLVKTNQPVKTGELLFQLDPAPFELAIKKAEAQLAQVRTNIEALKASYTQQQAEISLAQTNYGFALKEQKRQANLVAKKYTSSSSYDDAEQNAELASLKLVAAKKDLKRIAANLGGNVDIPVEQQPDYLAALADLEQAKLDLAHTRVSAPMDGHINTAPNPGQYLNAGQTVMALVVDKQPWVEANFTEKDLTYVKPGQPVSISIDTYPDTTWTGEVESLSPATSAEFSLLPAQNATGNWVKIAQRVPVRIRLKDTSGKPALRAGLSAITEIDTGHKNSLLGLTL